MIKETITYEDFDGTLTTEDMYFNLTRLELTELAMELPDELTNSVDANSAPNSIVAAITDKLGSKGIIDFIKRMVLKAYGIRRQGTDGKIKFIKTPQTTEEFANSLAYHNFVMELMTNDEKSTKFFTKVVPADVASQIPTGIGTEVVNN